MVSRTPTRMTKATFDRLYRGAERLGLVDSVGSAEYRRLLGEEVGHAAVRAEERRLDRIEAARRGKPRS